MIQLHREHVKRMGTEDLGIEYYFVRVTFRFFQLPVVFIREVGTMYAVDEVFFTMLVVAGVVCVDFVVGFAVLAVVGACVGTIPLHRSSLWHRGSKKWNRRRLLHSGKNKLSYGRSQSESRQFNLKVTTSSFTHIRSNTETLLCTVSAVNIKNSPISKQLHVYVAK